MILPLDELNLVQTRLDEYFVVEDGVERIRRRDDLYDIIDMLLDLFLLAYENGVASVNARFGTDIVPTVDEVAATIYRPIDGATWTDRLWAWLETGITRADVMRIAETEAHRDGNEAAFETAKKAGATTKTWLTMLDERVRETHTYLESVTVGIDDYFYTFDGDHAPAPGLFEKAENNISCRCELAFN